MRFRILGPLEVSDGYRPVSLGGTKQRATLGYLLLHANRVVPTSGLLDALWGIDEPPATARKILQNAVWGLRGLLGAGTDTLVTKAPGYLIRARPDEFDLDTFKAEVANGQAALADGRAEAADILRDALALWRGSALADLVETGTSWPELTAVQNARLDATEDYFDAELRCRRHQQMLGALETMVAAEPLRERLCAQLMLALYRCGRQADALAVYGRVRAMLVEELGVEPGRDLQTLQCDILNQDAVVLGGSSLREVAALPIVRSVLAEPAPLPARPVVQPRRRASVVLVRGRCAAENDLDDSGRLAARFRRLVESAEGVVIASIGSVSVAVFEPRSTDATDVDHTRRAVGVAATIIESVDDIGSTGQSTGQSAGGSTLSVRAVVGTEDIGARMTGPVVDRCQDVLSAVPVGEVWMCGETRLATASVIGCQVVPDRPDWWRVLPGWHGRDEIAVEDDVNLELELDALRGILERVRRRRIPHLVTVLGESGIDAAWLVEEFRARAADRPMTIRFLAVDATAYRGAGSRAVFAAILRAYCAIAVDDPMPVAYAKVADMVRRTVGSPEKAAWLVSCLGSLVIADASGTRRADIGEVLDALRGVLLEAARDCPIVLTIADLDGADHRLLDFIEELGHGIGIAPLLVVVAAGSELLRRRPTWAGGLRHSTTLSIDPRGDADRLIEPAGCPDSLGSLWLHTAS